jgi:hypothetical protein
LPLNCRVINFSVTCIEELLLTTAVGVRLALIMYASRISFLAWAELLNCLWMLASRCCGRDAILMEVRRAADDIT